MIGKVLFICKKVIYLLLRWLSYYMYGRKTFITQFFFFYSDVFLNSTKHFQTKLVYEADTFWTYMIKKKQQQSTYPW